MDVIHAAKILQVSEMEVFRRAYRLWYGTMDTMEVETDFRDFKQLGHIPHYVHQFTHRVVPHQSFIEQVKRWVNFME